MEMIITPQVGNLSPRSVDRGRRRDCGGSRSAVLYRRAGQGLGSLVCRGLRIMANPSHLKRLLEGVDGWNEWRRQHPEIKPDLSDARLVNADLERAVLDNADLRRADLSKAQLSHASLHSADLESATLILADLLGAVLNQANLTGTSFFGAFLFGTRLKSARLNGANLLGAMLMGADLSGADLTGAHLMSANFHEANLSDALLEGADLTAASLVGTRIQGARLSSCWVHGIAAWKLEGEPSVQSKLMITPRSDPPIWVGDLETAQCMSLLLYGRRPIPFASMTSESRVLLVLGRFRGPRQEVGDAFPSLVGDLGFVAAVGDLDRRGGPGGGVDPVRNVGPLLRASRMLILDTTGLKSSARLLEQLTAVVSAFSVLLVGKDVPAALDPAPAGVQVLASERYGEISELKTKLAKTLGSLGRTVE